MPKIIKKRIDRQADKEDLSGTVTDIRQRLKDNQRTMIYAVGAFLAIMACIISFTVYTKVNTNTAMDLEYEGYRLYYGDAKMQAVPPAERYQKALEKFRASYSAKKRPSALIYIADCYYELGKYDEAIKALNEFNDRFTDSRLLPLSYYKIAMAYVKKGDMDNALKILNSLSIIKDSPLRDMALLESGKILDSTGKSDEARKKYQELISKYPRSPLANEARMKLGESAANGAGPNKEPGKITEPRKPNK